MPPKSTKPAADDAADPKETPAVAPAATVRIYNKSRKQFSHDKHLSLPNAFITVPSEVADIWLKQFPDDFVTGEVAAAEANPSGVALEAAKVKTAELESEKMQLSAEIEELKKQLAEARGDKK